MSDIERDPDEKMLSVADFDRLIRERDDYKDRWETLGRVSKKVIDRHAAQLAGAVEAERARISAWLRRRAENVVDSGAHAGLVKAADDLDAEREQ